MNVRVDVHKLEEFDMQSNNGVALVLTKIKLRWHYQYSEKGEGLGVRFFIKPAERTWIKEELWFAEITAELSGKLCGRLIKWFQVLMKALLPRLISSCEIRVTFSFAQILLSKDKSVGYFATAHSRICICVVNC